MNSYQYVNYPQPHPGRRKEILAKYPEVKNFFRPYPLSALWIVGLVLIQWLIGIALEHFQIPWWGLLITAYAIGAFINHALYVLIHECSHNLVFGHPTLDKIMGIVCDFALVFPSSMGFRRYHLIHHTHLGQFDHDADLVSHQEGQLVGNSSFKKILWITFFMFSQGVLRPLRLKNIKLWNSWTVVNIVLIVCLDIFIFKFLGSHVFFYLAASTFFALGLHPLGGRWIQEHYITKQGQETYSYYGPLNKVTFNMGYHNEHHDFFMAPWPHLPKIKKMAPEYYNELESYSSWTKVLWHFLTSPKMSPFSRIVHQVDAKNSAKDLAELSF